MKRDMDLIRDILKVIESKKPFETTRDLIIDGHNMQEVAYHCELLYDGGYIKEYRAVSVDNYNGVAAYWVRDLTWEGHDFLEAIRQDTIWNKTKTTIIEKGLAITVGTVKTIATAFITAASEGVATAILKSGGQS